MAHTNIASETLIPFDQARRELSEHLTRDQLDYWRKHGIVVNRSGSRRKVKLESLRIGGRRFTSKEAYQRFLDAIN
jgi:hypothetical protein